MAYANISDLIGKTFVKIDKSDDEILFLISEHGGYKMYHSQDCCENVYVEDIIGDLSDLVETPILTATEDTNSDNPKEYSDSHTWTFYNIATMKGHVTIRWYGTSNGYYSESVNIVTI